MVREIYDPGQFFSEAWAGLGAGLAKNSLLLGLASQFQFDRQGCHFEGIYGQDFPDPRNIYSLVAEHAGYFNYVCSESSDFDALMALLDLCLERNILPTSAVSDSQTAKLLQVCFEERNFQTRPMMRQVIYRCDQPVLPAGGIEGLHLMQAREEHLQALTRWTSCFINEAIPNKRPQGDAETQTLEKIKKGSLHLLHNGELFLAMANWARPLPGAVSLNFVYVPPELRGKGYGKAICYLLTKKMICDEGYLETNLYADASSQEANEIYKKIGYVEVVQSEHFEVISKY